MPVFKTFKPLVDEGHKIIDFWHTSRAGTYGASVAYYTIFSLAPVLVIAISIMTFFVSETTATAGVIAEFTKLFGSAGANFIMDLVNSNISQGTTIITSIIGFAILLIGSLKIFSEVQSALDAIFEELPQQRVRSLTETLKKKFLSFGMIVSLGFILLVSLVLSTLISALSSEVGAFLPGIESVTRIIEFIISFGLISFFLATMYKLLPSHKLAWKPAIVGGLIAGILFTISKYLLGLYLGSSALLSSFGTASALVLIILWAYYMAQVFFFAAVLTKIYIVPRLK